MSIKASASIVSALRNPGFFRPIASIMPRYNLRIRAMIGATTHFTSRSLYHGSNIANKYHSMRTTSSMVAGYGPYSSIVVRCIHLPNKDGSFRNYSLLEGSSQKLSRHTGSTLSQRHYQLPAGLITTIKNLLLVTSKASRLYPTTTFRHPRASLRHTSGRPTLPQKLYKQGLYSVRLPLRTEFVYFITQW